jgi:dynein heavy chain
MTGVLQNHSRKYEIPINTIDFSFDVLTKKPEEITEGPDDGVICCGMFLEGARWDAENAVVVDSKVHSPPTPFDYTTLIK